MTSERPRSWCLAEAERALGTRAAAIVWAPGRVNLIGEHTDYSLLPVLPMAIDRGTAVAVASERSGSVHVRSILAEAPWCTDRARLALEPGAELWHRYVVGVLHQLRDAAPEAGARIAVAGNLPTGGGLSSSASLTMGLLCALTEAWGLELAPERLIADAIAAERHAGAATGGMDQTVIAYARGGHALRIDFLPPARRHIALPATLHVVVANSGEVAAKGGAARRAYAERVLGCRWAASMLAQRLGLPLRAPAKLGVVAQVPGVERALDDLPEQACGADVARVTGLPLATLLDLGTGPAAEIRSLPVRAYARHVLGEAARVAAAEQALGASDLAALGALMDASQRSLQRDFGCSTRRLDELCAAMRSAGALGARLTGAGFGGHAIAIATAERLEPVKLAAQRATGEPAFAVVPSPGLWGRSAQPAEARP